MGGQGSSWAQEARANSPREAKEKYIQAKYDRKEWIAPLPSPHSPAQSLVDAICRCDMAEVSLALSHCKQEDVNSSLSHRDERTPLHLASALGNLPIAQLLIWANANVLATDHEARTCISHARSSGAMVSDGRVQWVGFIRTLLFRMLLLYFWLLGVLM